MKQAMIALVIGSFTMLTLVGCDDPAKDKTKAVVGSAKATTAASNQPKGASYEIAEGSKFEFVGSKAVGEHPGGFKKFTGTANLNGDKIEGGSVTVDVDMTSVFSDADGLTKHLKNADFFDVEKHPKSKFVSTSIKKGGDKGASHTIVGNLTLRGKTSSIAFPAKIATSGDTGTVDAEFTINRKDFGIMYKGKADNLINDLVVIKLSLKLKKKS